MLCWLIGGVGSVAIDNGVVGTPALECSESGIRLQVETRKPFVGRIFVKGESANAECSTAVGDRSQFGPDDKQLFSLDFDNCGMYRLRMLNPKGMLYTTTVVVSFHPLFVTKIDRAYKVECFYGEVEKTVKVALNVSVLPTTELFDRMEMPQCHYSVRSESVDGPTVRFARVGDKVVHRWECSSGDMYRFLVKNCFVENGSENRVAVVNENGCPIDPVLLSPVRYEQGRSVVWAESHVFKFADVTLLNFQCQIQICVHHHDGCRDVTPPQCPQQPAAAVPTPSSSRAATPAAFDGRALAPLPLVGRVPLFGGGRRQFAGPTGPLRRLGSAKKQASLERLLNNGGRFRRATNRASASDGLTAEVDVRPEEIVVFGVDELAETLRLKRLGDNENRRLSSSVGRIQRLDHNCSTGSLGLTVTAILTTFLTTATLTSLLLCFCLRCHRESLSKLINTATY